MDASVPAADNSARNGALGMVEDRFAREDAERKEWLDWIVKRAGKCRACGANVGDEGLVKHPGVCATCLRKRHVAPLTPPTRTPEPRPAPANPEPSPTAATVTPAMPAEEDTVPRGKLAEPRKCCGSMGTTHKAGCEQAGSKVVPAPAEEPKRARRPAREPEADDVAWLGEVEARTDGEVLAALELLRAEIARRLEEREAVVERLRAAAGAA